MAEHVQMLALSPTMEEGTVVEWQKKVGDEISTGDIICQVETDKATMDYESSQEGTLLAILVDEGRQAAVGDPIAIIGEKGEDFSALLGGAAGGGKAGAKDKKPESGTDEKAGRPDSQKGKGAPEETSVGDTERRESGKKKEDPGERERVKESENGENRDREGAGYHVPGSVKASPLARKLASDRGIDLSGVTGSGPAGRIVKEDIENYSPAAAGHAGKTAGGKAPSRSAVGRATPGERRIPVGGKRAVIARRLSESKFSAPHFYLRKSVFMEEIFTARELLNRKAKEKVGLNAFIVKLVAEALKRHPFVNAGWQTDEIVQFGTVDIGIAVALSDGLIVPVVRDCGGKGILEIDEELKELIEKARSGKLTPEEYTGATFTISNLGGYGIDEFTAIINPPGSAILALGAAKKEPVVDENDDIVIRQVMRLTLSCDHRVIDGAVGAAFLSDLSEFMENPVRALY